MYPVTIGSVISEGVQQVIAILQLQRQVCCCETVSSMGIALAGVNFLGWVIWFSTTEISMVFICRSTCFEYVVLYVHFYPPEKESEPPIE